MVQSSLNDYIRKEVPLPNKVLRLENHLDAFDKFIVMFSGGKDSTACVLYLLELGIPKEMIELWHQCIDGKGEDYVDFFDWKCTEDYCRKFADYIGIPIYFGWRKQGLYAEMMRDKELGKPICFENLDGSVTELEPWDQERFKISRMRFPQTSTIKNGRYCSIKVKIEIARAQLIHRADLQDLNVLVVSGERFQESPAREGLKTYEIEHGVYNQSRNHLRWRAVHGWTEEKVWEIIRRWGIRPHPSYELGWGRTSCMLCIFGNKNMWATVGYLLPEKLQMVSRLEKEFADFHLKNKDKICAVKKQNCEECKLAKIQCTHPRKCPVCTRLEKMDEPRYTIHNGITVLEMADAGEVYDLDGKEDIIKLAMSYEYTEDIYIGKDNWEYPDGAFGENAGPI